MCVLLQNKAGNKILFKMIIFTKPLTATTAGKKERDHLSEVYTEQSITLKWLSVISIYGFNALMIMAS